jgi:hypothetical protein
MVRLLTSTLAVLALVAVMQAQAALSGRWRGVTPAGAQVLLDLTVQGTTLEGTVTRDGETGKIVDGKVSKNTFTFRATVGAQSGAFTGELEGDEITVWLDHLGRESATVLTRVKT